MGYKLILKELEKNYGWINTKEFTKMQKELVNDVAKIISSQIEPPIKSANGDIIKAINEFFDDYFLDKDNCFYIDSLTFKNKINFASLIMLQIKIDLLSNLSA